MKKICLLIIASFLMGCWSFGFLWFESKDVKERRAKLLGFVTEAEEFYNKNGKEVAFEEFQDKNGKFVRGEYYVFAFNMDGVCLVHPINKKLINRNLSKLKDSKRKLFVKEYLNTMKKGKYGWVDYYWTHPTSKKNRAKLVRLVRVDDDVFLGAGIYKSE